MPYADLFTRFDLCDASVHLSDLPEAEPSSKDVGVITRRLPS